ncbi:MAG: 4-hydroxy-tetrahydrodipicolinate synthase [Leptospiraceae bacterium]|nr:4-hydroxy-tetrahydrodipicolinate synthase [Leptospiraceae bacterium]
MFQGVFTAIVTPFQNDRIDYDVYYKLLDRQIQAGVSGVIPCGTTGESPTLSHEEHSELIRKTVEYCKSRIQVIAGTGSNSTKEAVELTELACKDGVDGILSVNPYYNKPTQEGLYLHFKTIAEHSSKPVMLYNIPGRTSVNLSPETTRRLSEISNIRSLKEATGDLAQMSKSISILPSNFSVLSGDDTLTLPLLSVGGRGVVSVVSNIFPKKIKELVDSFESGNLNRAREIHYSLLPVFNNAFLETNPIPVKAALYWLGLISNEIRLPLTPLTPSRAAEDFKALVLNLREKGFE